MLAHSVPLSVKRRRFGALKVQLGQLSISTNSRNFPASTRDVFDFVVLVHPVPLPVQRRRFSALDVQLKPLSIQHSASTRDVWFRGAGALCSLARSATPLKGLECTFQTIKNKTRFKQYFYIFTFRRHNEICEQASARVSPNLSPSAKKHMFPS